MMSFKEFMELAKAVLLDWRVIATVLVMFFAVSMANKIIHYRKRPKKNKKKRIEPAPAPKPEATQPKAEESEE